MLESSAPCRYFNSSPEVIHLVVMMHARYPLSLRNVEDLLAERGINISHGLSWPGIEIVSRDENLSCGCAGEVNCD
jgi:hypothetical protein